MLLYQLAQNRSLHIRSARSFQSLLIWSRIKTVIWWPFLLLTLVYFALLCHEESIVSAFTVESKFCVRIWKTTTPCLYYYVAILNTFIISCLLSLLHEESSISAATDESKFCITIWKQTTQYYALIRCYITFVYHILPLKFVYTDNIQVCVSGSFGFVFLDNRKTFSLRIGKASKFAL